MEVIVTAGAKKQLKKLSKISRILVIEKLKKLELNFPPDVKKLKGYKNAHRIRVGDYRIVYRIIGGRIYVVLIAHRKEVYELLERLLK